MSCLTFFIIYFSESMTCFYLVIIRKLAFNMFIKFNIVYKFLITKQT